MDQTPELQSAIEHLYFTFASYQLRENTEACTCCHNPQDEERLHRKELRRLNSRDLEQYAMDALFVWGGVYDFKHFIPRIFELAATCGGDFLDPEMVFNKLHYGEWRAWPEPEQLAVERFFGALWHCVLDNPTHKMYGDEIDGWLCGIAQAVGDLSPYLTVWLAAETENARLNLARFIAETDFANPKYRPDAFWGERADLFDEVAAWVRSDTVKSRLAEIAAQYPQYDFVERAYTLLC